MSSIRFQGIQHAVFLKLFFIREPFISETSWVMHLPWITFSELMDQRKLGCFKGHTRKMSARTCPTPMVQLSKSDREGATRCGW